MIPTALSCLPALFLPLAVQIAHRSTVWLVIAAAAGFTLPPLARFALAEKLASGSDGLFRDTYYIFNRAPVDATLALILAALALLQFLKTRLDREDRRTTAILFWILLLAALGSRLVVTVAIPAAAPTRYVDYPTALRPWERLHELCFLIALATLALLIALMILAPLWRGAAGTRRGGP